MNWNAFDISILIPALLAGLLVASTHVPLGQRVLQRGIIFLDLAVAQVAGLGIILAYSLQWEPGSWQMQLVAFSAAFLGVLILNYTEKHWPDIQEALIGTLFVLASSGSILLLTANPHGGEQLKEILVGQILWVTYEQLIPVFVLYIAILGIWFGLAKKLTSLHFYLIFACAVTASVQLVGIYLVFSTLILPALVMRNVKKHTLLTGYFVACLGYVLGLIFAALLDMPAGAMVVYSLAVCALVVVLTIHFLFTHKD